MCKNKNNTYTHECTTWNWRKNKKYEERVKRIFKKHDNVLNLEKHLEKCRYHNQLRNAKKFIKKSNSHGNYEQILLRYGETMSNNFKEFVKGLPKVFPDKFADKETLSYDRDKTTH